MKGKRRNKKAIAENLELLNFLLLPERYDSNSSNSSSSRATSEGSREEEGKGNERREIKSIVRTLLIKENAKKDFNFEARATHYEILASVESMVEVE